MAARVHFPSAPVRHPADLRNRVNSQWYSSIYEDWTPKIEDIERSDGETIKPGVLKRPELDRVNPKCQLKTSEHRRLRRRHH